MGARALKTGDLVRSTHGTTLWKISRGEVGDDGEAVNFNWRLGVVLGQFKIMRAHGRISVDYVMILDSHTGHYGACPKKYVRLVQ